METDSLLGRGRPARRRALAGAALLCAALAVLAPRARETSSAAVAPEALGARHTTTARPPPHIILVLADDIGHSDVGYSADAALAQTVRTPTLDALAHAGVRLSRFYSAPDCTPARAALLTGRYPVALGSSHGSIGATSDWAAVPLSISMLPERLAAGTSTRYSTHMVGKVRGARARAALSSRARARI